MNASGNGSGVYTDAELRQKINQRRRIEISQPTGKIKDLLSKYYKETEGWRKSIIDWAREMVPETIPDPDGKDVEVSRTSIRNVISHGKGPLKILTIPHLPHMLKNGVLFYTEAAADKQSRPEKYYNYAYPVHFDGKDWAVSITVKEDYNGKRFYDDEFVREIKSTDGLPNGTGPSTRGNLTHPSVASILQKILAVNLFGYVFPA
jgi:hypothetical protein